MSTIIAPDTTTASNTTYLNSNVVTDVVATSDSKNIIIPFNKGQESIIKEEVEDLQTRFSEIIAKKYNLDISKVRDCIPDNITFQEIHSPNKPAIKSTKQTNKYNLDNWRDVEAVTDLKQLKVAQLKDIINSEGIDKTSGSKTVLMNRVWGILHPDEIIDTPPKKRGRTSSKKTNTTIVNDTDDEELTSDIMESLLQGATTVTMKDGSNKEVVMEKGWVFIMSGDQEPEYEWVGMLNSDNNSYTECDPPTEITNIYA